MVSSATELPHLATAKRLSVPVPASAAKPRAASRIGTRSTSRGFEWLATGRTARRTMRPSGTGADPGPAPGPRIAFLRSVDPNLPAAPVGASFRSGAVPIPRRDLDSSSSIRRSHPRRGFPMARPLLEVGGGLRLPGEMGPVSSLGRRSGEVRNPEPGAGRRAPGRPAGSWEPAWRPCSRRTAPPAPARPLPACALQIESLPETLLASNGGIMAAETDRVNPKREIPSHILRIGEKSPAGHSFSTALSTPMASLDHHPA